MKNYKDFENLLDNSGEDFYVLRDYCLRYLKAESGDKDEKAIIKLLEKSFEGEYIVGDVIRLLARLNQD